jgi:hypothetical protein
MDPRERLEADFLREQVDHIVEYWQAEWHLGRPGALVVAYEPHQLDSAPGWFFADLEDLERVWDQPHHPDAWVRYARHLILQATEWNVPVISLHAQGIHAHMWHTAHAIAWRN